MSTTPGFGFQIRKAAPEDEDPLRALHPATIFTGTGWRILEDHLWWLSGGAYHSIEAKYLRTGCDKYSFRYNCRNEGQLMFTAFLKIL